MSQHATELCLLLVDDMYGDITSAVFEVLQKFGRLALPPIVQHSSLSMRQVKHGLAVLIQQHLAFWYLSPDDDTVYYEPNFVNAYAIAQFGKHASRLQERLGETAASIISELLVAGHARLQDLENAYKKSLESKATPHPSNEVLKSNGHPINGILKSTKASQEVSSDDFYGAFEKLTEERYISILHESYVRSEADNRKEAKRLVYNRPVTEGPLKGEEKAAFEAAVKEILAEWKYGTGDSIRDIEHKIMANAANRGIKKVTKTKKDDVEAKQTATKKRKRQSHNISQIDGLSDAVGEEQVLAAPEQNKEDIVLIEDEQEEAHSTPKKRKTDLTNATSTSSEKTKEIAPNASHEGDKNQQEEIQNNSKPSGTISNGQEHAEPITEKPLGNGHTAAISQAAAADALTASSTAAKSRKRALPEEDIDNGEDTINRKKRLTNGNVRMNGQTESLGVEEAPKHEDVPDHPLVEEEETVIRVNLNKLTVIARNERLIDEADKSIGPITSIVYSKLLRRIEKHISHCETNIDENEDDENDAQLDIGAGPRVSTMELLEDLEGVHGLYDSIHEMDPEKVDLPEFTQPDTQPGNHQHPEDWDFNEQISNNHEELEDNYNNVRNDSNGNARNVQDGTTRLGDAMATEDTRASPIDNADADEVKPSIESQAALPSPPRPEQVRRHLFLLSTHNPPFLVYHPRTPHQSETWSVPFPTLIRKLRLSTLFATIKDRYGMPAHRLVRILHERGKLDEKNLTTVSLLNQKTMRASLAAMHGAGFLELQEIPRDHNRQPSRTVFLWHFDPHRCALQAIDGAYQAMARLLQRLKVEREAVKLLLRKAERSDVEGREAEFLSSAEMTRLNKWRETEARIWGEVARLDDVVCLLRDY